MFYFLFYLFKYYLKIFIILQVKFIKLKIDDRELVERGTVQVRRGPGHCRYNFGQKIPLLPKHCPARSKELSAINPIQHISMKISLIHTLRTLYFSE